MGTIRDSATGQQHLLQPEHIVGRGPGCALRIEERHVSAQHAILRWTAGRWEVRDLGSRNGTFLDGSRMMIGRDYRLPKGCRVAFGKLEHEWVLIDDGPAVVMAVPLEGGEPIVIDGDLLALPSSDDPHATIHRHSDGSWLIEDAEHGTAPLANLQTFEVQGHPFKFCCPESRFRTSLADPESEIEVRQLQLTFLVSQDEEHVELKAASGARSFNLGARSYNYLLLTLARQRIEDTSAGTPETSSGWVHQEDLEHDPSMAAQQLNISVFRIRKRFAAIGIVDAANIIERRPHTRQLRIGTGRLAIEMV